MRHFLHFILKFPWIDTRKWSFLYDQMHTLTGVAAGVDLEAELKKASEAMSGGDAGAAYFILNGRFFRAFSTKNRCKLGEFG